MKKISEKYKRLKGAQKFFIFCILFYVGLFFVSADIFISSLDNFFSMSRRIIPLLGLVFLAMVFVNYFLTQEKIKKHLGNERGPKAFLYSTIAGILVSGPPFVLFPMLAELKKKGLSDFHLAVFLYNRNVKIPFFPALVFYFGLAYSIVLSVYIIIFSYFNGLILTRFMDRKNNN